MSSDNNDLYQFINCKILRNHKIITEDLWVRNGKIVNPEKIFFDEKIQSKHKIDCGGKILAPGLIDVQINGGFGYDFSLDTGDIEKVIGIVAKGVIKHGVTAFCPTIVTSKDSVYHYVLPKIKKEPGGVHGAAILGVHVEGPFISPDKKGAHPIGSIKSIENVETIRKTYGDLSNVKIITIAPELPNALNAIKELSEEGIVISMGHSTANLAEAEEGAKNGATMITHLFNAMMPFHHRDPGLVGLLASRKVPLDKVFFGIIADGYHTDPAALRIAYQVHPKGLVLVTDAIAALGLQEGRYNLGEYPIEVRNGVAYIANTNTLCGSIAPLIDSIKIFYDATGCTFEYALEAASLHPARVLGIENVKGTLDFGADADFIMIDEDFKLKSTWIAGECVYDAAV